MQSRRMLAGRWWIVFEFGLVELLEIKLSTCERVDCECFVLLWSWSCRVGPDDFRFRKFKSWRYCFLARFQQGHIRKHDPT